METLFKNRFLEIMIDRERKFAQVAYFEETQNLTVEEYIENTTTTANYFKTFLNEGIDKILFDTRNNFYPISVDLQAWTVKQFEQFSQINYKSATILSTDLITMLSIEQAVDGFNDQNKRLNNSFFDNEEDAMEWLFS